MKKYLQPEIVVNDLSIEDVLSVSKVDDTLDIFDVEVGVNEDL